MKKLILILILTTMVFLTACSIPKGCTQEAKLCPDGSSVGRTGPDCEFAPCPEECTQDSDCIKAGCSGTLCISKNNPQESPYTTCEWKEEYECYQDITCGCVDGKCDWKDKESLDICIDEKKTA